MGKQSHSFKSFIFFVRVFHKIMRCMTLIDDFDMNVRFFVMIGNVDVKCCQTIKYPCIHSGHCTSTSKANVSARAHSETLNHYL